MTVGCVTGVACRVGTATLGVGVGVELTVTGAGLGGMARASGVEGAVTGAGFGVPDEGLAIGEAGFDATGDGAFVARVAVARGAVVRVPLVRCIGADARVDVAEATGAVAGVGVVAVTAAVDDAVVVAAVFSLSPHATSTVRQTTAAIPAALRKTNDSLTA